MLRITGGTYKGHRLTVPDRRVRPTQERVREALFSAMGGDLSGCRVLDLFAGSGAFGLEALSRGADYVCWVEKQAVVYATLKENVQNLTEPDDPRCRLLQKDALTYLRETRGEPSYNLIFADPPYDPQGHHQWLQKSLLHLTTNPMLTANGKFVFEAGDRDPLPDSADGWSVVWERSYGDTRVLIFAPENS